MNVQAPLRGQRRCDSAAAGPALRHQQRANPLARNRLARKRHIQLPPLQFPTPYQNLAQWRWRLPGFAACTAGPQCGLESDPPDGGLVQPELAVLYLNHRILPWKKIDGVTVHVTDQPENAGQALKALGEADATIAVAPSVHVASLSGLLGFSGSSSHHPTARRRCVRLRYRSTEQGARIPDR